MNQKMVQALAVLMALNMEALIILGFAWWIGGILNEKYPKSGIGWDAICLVIGLVVVVNSWVIMIRWLVKNQSEHKYDE